MRGFRKKILVLGFFMVIGIGQLFPAAIAFNAPKANPLGMTDSAKRLQKASQDSHQVYCVNEWQAQLQSNPYSPAQKKHGILGIQFDPHLPTQMDFTLLIPSRNADFMPFRNLYSHLQVPETPPPRI